MEVIVTNVSKLGLFHLFTGRIQPRYIEVKIHINILEFRQDVPGS